MVFKAAPVQRSVSKSVRLIQGGSPQLSFPLFLEYIGAKMEGFRIVFGRQARHPTGHPPSKTQA